MSVTWKTASWLAVGLLIVAVPVVAQDNGGKELPNWGTLQTSCISVAAPAFTPYNPSNSNWNYHTAGYWYRSGTDQYFGASVYVPTGAKIVHLEVEGCDSDASGDVRLWLKACFWSNTSSCTNVPTGGVGSSGTPGCSFWFDPVSITVGNSTNSYHLQLQVGASGLTTKVRTARVCFERQVTPAPGFATFNDVPVGSFGFQHIEALAASGITSGCGGGSFCPNKTLTRVEMAIFLAKALGLHFPY